MTRALPLLLNDGAAVHTRGPLPTFSPSQGSQSRVKLLLPSRSPHTVPSHTVILLSCPHGPGMGGRFPGKRGLGPLLSAFTRGAAAGESGRGVLSAALSLAPTPVSRVPGLPPVPDAPAPEIWSHRRSWEGVSGPSLASLPPDTKWTGRPEATGPSVSPGLCGGWAGV